MNKQNLCDDCIATGIDCAKAKKEFSYERGIIKCSAYQSRRHMSGKSKTICISDSEINPEKLGHSGIDITYIKSRRVLQISGWFDSCCGIGEVEIPVEKFCELLGISSEVSNGK